MKFYVPTPYRLNRVGGWENLQKPCLLFGDFPRNGLRGSRGKPGLVPQAIRHFGVSRNRPLF